MRTHAHTHTRTHTHTHTPPAQLRLDARVPGTVLLRDKGGRVYYITLNNIQQV
jgi:hypothetical protein